MDDENLSSAVSSTYGDLGCETTSLHDSSINGEGDRIATALLTERGNGESAPGHVRACTPAIKAQLSLLMASAAPSRFTNFLSLTCHSAVLSEASRKSIAEGENHRLRKIGHQSREVYNWAGVTLLSTDSHGMCKKSLKSINADAVLKRDPSINASMKQWKMDNLNKSKAELRLLEKVAINRKIGQNDAQIVKMKFRKNLDDFRKKLKERLLKINDPLIGDVMRCIDYSMVHYIIENHKGLNLTVDDTLDLMGFPKEKKMQAEIRKEFSDGKGAEIRNTAAEKLYRRSFIFSDGDRSRSGSCDIIDGTSIFERRSAEPLSHLQYGINSDSEEQYLQGYSTPLPWGMGGELSPKNKSRRVKLAFIDTTSKYGNIPRNDCINVTQRELSMRAFAEASSNGELKAAKNNNNFMENRDEYPVSKNNRRGGKFLSSSYDQDGSSPSSLCYVPLSDYSLSNPFDTSYLGNDTDNMRNVGHRPVMIYTQTQLRRSSTSSTTSTSSSTSTSISRNENEVGNESTIFLTAGDSETPSPPPSPAPSPTISLLNRHSSSTLVDCDDIYPLPTVRTQRQHQYQHENESLHSHEGANESLMEIKNENTVGNVTDGDIALKAEKRSTKKLSFSDDFDDEATVSKRNSISNTTEGTSRFPNLGSDILLPVSGITSGLAVRWAMDRDEDMEKSKVREDDKIDPTSLPFHGLSMRNRNVLLPIPSSIPVSPTPSYALSSTSLSQYKRIPRKVYAPTFPDRDRAVERDWDKDRYGARVVLSAHLPTSGKWCLPLKRNSGRYVLGHSNISRKDLDPNYVTVTPYYSNNVSILQLTPSKPFF